MKKYRLAPFLFHCVILCVFCNQARHVSAALNVSVLNTSVNVGGTGFIDVVITGANDLVQSHQLDLLITPSFGNTTSLQFAFPQTTSYSSLANYIYFNDSANEIAGAPYPKDFLNVAGPSFLDFDNTDSGGDVMVNGQRLLARVDVEHIVPFGTDPNTVLGDTFTVSIVQSDFFDSGATMVPLGVLGSGTVSLSSAAVPEPSSLVLIATGLTAIGARRRWKQLGYRTVD